MEDIDFVRKEVLSLVDENSELLADSAVHVAEPSMGNGFVNMMVRVRLKKGIKYCDVGQWRPLNDALVVRVTAALHARNIHMKAPGGVLDPRHNLRASEEPVVKKNTNN